MGEERAEGIRQIISAYRCVKISPVRNEDKLSGT